MATLIQKLLGQQKHPSAAEGDSHALPDDQPIHADQSASSSTLNWNFGADQAVGHHRDHNEDALYTFGTHLAYQDIQVFAGLFVVADGMGGHANGELASSLAVRTMAELVVGALFDLFITNQPSPDPDKFKQLLLASLQESNRQVKKQVPGGGTTLTASLIYKDQLMVAHVGDSRAYLVQPDGAVQALTRDHSFVRQLVEIGQITDEEAAVHPQRNILSMALGQWEPLEPDYVVRPLPARSHVLLCSDGLWGVVPEKKLAQIILSSASPQKACQKLIEAANQAGGPDNITAIVISIPE